ncbi:hypothetical protein EVAR_5263_1 [Eumeta japonica]|uniref:Uncharacterized protein n=1 Tax=Eumeta variegata TaxID=151549 RepID=A0A4C1XSF2_EUMVA|nr:hypothetical protein EVAR_5263_1 [Eumeta japonica]
MSKPPTQRVSCASLRILAPSMCELQETTASAGAVGRGATRRALSYQCNFMTDRGSAKWIIGRPRGPYVVAHFVPPPLRGGIYASAVLRLRYAINSLRKRIAPGRPNKNSIAYERRTDGRTVRVCLQPVVCQAPNRWYANSRSL